MKESKLFSSLLTAIVVVVLCAPAVSQAGDKSDLEGVSVKVSYADLNLAKQEGAKALYRRLQQASKRACDYQQGLRFAGSWQRLSVTKKCYQETLANAVEDLDNQLVTRIHNS